MAWSELLDRKPRQLSGGQRQRVAMGRAIVREPAAFLMDEPLSNLDAKLRVEMRGEITSLQRRISTPTLYVTHDQTEAMTMGDRVAILRDGVLEQLGTPAELYDEPGERVRGFVHRVAGDEPDRGGLPCRGRVVASSSGPVGDRRARLRGFALRRAGGLRRAARRRRDPARGLHLDRVRRAGEHRGRGDAGRVARLGALRVLPHAGCRRQPWDRR